MSPDGCNHHDSSAGREPVRLAPRCERCGERIGTYERLAYELPDGSVATSGLLVLPEEARRPEHRARLFHLACRPVLPPRGPSAA